MKRKANWLKSYGIWVKIYVGLIFFILLNGQNVFLGIKDILSDRSHLPTAKYDSYFQGSLTGKYAVNTSENDDWLKRKDLANQEIKQILAEIKAKGENYTSVDYFRNLSRVMDLEDKYKLQLMGGMMMPFERIYQASIEALRHEKPLSAEESAYIQKVQDKHGFRIGMDPARAAASINWLAVLVWVAKKYFWLMLFWGLIYLVRFLERDKSIRLFQRHHHELNRFIDDREPYPEKLSLKDELLLCPERFFCRIILWPLYCWYYPHHESPAALARYLGLRAHLLKYKPFGYQLSIQEDAQLRLRARVRVKNFDQAVKELFSFDTATLVKKSLLTAQLSLMCGVLFQPAIVLAATYSEKAEKHFFCPLQIQLVQNQQQAQDNPGIGPPDDHSDSANTWLIVASVLDLVIPRGIGSLVVDQVNKKLLDIVFDIEHIPLNRLFTLVRVY